MKVVPFPPGGNDVRGVAAHARVVASLDIGSTKICSLIGRLDRRGGASVGQAVPGIEILGAGYCEARGIRAGQIVDVEAAEASIRTAIDQAERMAGLTLSDVHVNLSAGRPRSELVTGRVELGHEPITRQHLRQAIAAALAGFDAGERQIIHASVAQWRVDDAVGVRQPLGQHGQLLEAAVNVVSADPRGVANLSLLLERCHLDVAGLAVAPLASARSVLLADEMELGVTLIEFGGGMTSFSVFNEGILAHSDCIALGSHHVTMDLARGLNTTIAHAERVKTRWGSALPISLDEREFITCPVLGEAGSEAVNRIPRSMISGVIQPRLEEIFELVRERLDRLQLTRHLARRVVLAGGGSQLEAVDELAAQVLGRPVRLGVPHKFSGLPQGLETPAVCVASGLLRHVLGPARELADLDDIATEADGRGTYFSRVGQWLRESI